MYQLILRSKSSLLLSKNIGYYLEIIARRRSRTRRVFKREQRNEMMRRRRINWIKLNAEIKRSLVAHNGRPIVFVTITYPMVSSIVRARPLRQRVLCVWQLRWMTLLPRKWRALFTQKQWRHVRRVDCSLTR